MNVVHPSATVTMASALRVLPRQNKANVPHVQKADLVSVVSLVIVHRVVTRLLTSARVVMIVIVRQ